MTEKVKHIFKSLTKPVIEEFPLFVTLILLNGTFVILQNLHGMIDNPEKGFTIFGFFCRFCIIVLQAYICTAIVWKVNKKWLKIACYAWFFILAILEQFLWVNFYAGICPTVLRLVAETNTGEASEFLATYLTKNTLRIYGVPFVLLIAVCVAEHFRSAIASALRHRMPRLAIGGLALICVVCGIYSCKVYVPLFKAHDTDYASRFLEAYDTPKDLNTKTIVAACCIHWAKEEMAAAKEVVKQTANLPITCSDEGPLDIVFVMGEAFNRMHSALYGYEKQTNPKLTAEQQAGNLFVFTDMVSPLNQTTPVIKNTLSCNSLLDNESWWNSPQLNQLFKQAGFQVLFWDNQHSFALLTFFTFGLNTFLYDPDLMPMLYTATNDKPFTYDGELVDDFRDNAYAKLSDRNLVMFHLMGQHTYVGERYPAVPEFQHFTADSVTRTDSFIDRHGKEVIADYDNATRYNDFVLSEIIGMFRGRNAVVIYFSDHGEDVYDYRAFYGRDLNTHLSKELLQTEYAVPMMIWVSDSFRGAHPQYVADIAAAVDKPGMLDNLCQILFHLGSLQTDFYHADRDLLSPSYRVRDRILMRGNTNYDAVMRGDAK